MSITTIMLRYLHTCKHRALIYTREYKQIHTLTNKQTRIYQKKTLVHIDTHRRPPMYVYLTQSRKAHTKASPLLPSIFKKVHYPQDLGGVAGLVSEAPLNRLNVSFRLFVFHMELIIIYLVLYK